MDDERLAAFLRTLDAERVLLSQLVVLNQQFHDVLGEPAGWRQLDHRERTEQEARLQALREQSRALHEEMRAVQRAYHDAYPS